MATKSVESYCKVPKRGNFGIELSFLARVIKPSHEGQVDDATAKQQLIQELREHHLIDSTELAADFQKALAPLWDSRSSFALKVEPFAEEVDVEALFDDYQRRK